MDISDGIFAATVLEHSTENYQNIKVPSNDRALNSAMRGWLREYAETLQRFDGTSGYSSHQTQSTGPMPMEVDQTRAVSCFLSGKDGKKKSTGKGKNKDGKGKSKSKKSDNGKDHKPISKPQRTARCGETSVPTARNASPTPSRRVVQQRPLLTKMETTKRQQVGALLLQMCAAVGSTDSLLPKSGSDDHVCAPKFADLLSTGPDRNTLKLKEVYLAISSEKTALGS